MLTSEKLIHKQSILMSDNGFQWDEAVEGNDTRYPNQGIRGSVEKGSKGKRGDYRLGPSIRRKPKGAEKESLVITD